MEARKRLFTFFAVYGFFLILTCPLFKIVNLINSTWSATACFITAFILSIFWTHLNLILEKLEELKK